VRYIMENTSNQYLIASHSNAFFDMPDANIYRCRMEDGSTQCELASRADQKHALLTDLGYRPSDLLQSNYVIWVEGPSDRIYINHWINAEADELVEGIHYSIMFYGGSLLAHLSYDKSYDDEKNVNDFIRLARLNRNACIVMDSDKKKPRSRIDKKKRRVKSEFEEYNCLVWITKGRMIENYVAEDTLNTARAGVHTKKGKKPVKWGQYEDLTNLAEMSKIDKVRVARHVADQPADLSTLDLKKMVSNLIAEIRRCNRVD